MSSKIERRGRPVALLIGKDGPGPGTTAVSLRRQQHCKDEKLRTKKTRWILLPEISEQEGKR